MKNKNKNINILFEALVILLFSALFLIPLKVKNSAAEEISNTNQATGQGNEANQQSEVKDLNDEELQQEIEKLRKTLNSKETEIDDLDEQITNYQRIVDQKEQELLSVKNQIDTLNTKINQSNDQLQKTRLEIEKNQLEILETQITIEAESRKIKNQKKLLGEYIRQLYQQKNRSYLEIIISENKFSDFFQKIYFLEKSQKELTQTIKGIKQLKDELIAQETELEGKKQELVKLNFQLDSNKKRLESDQAAQQVIYNETSENEKEFQELLKSIQAEQANINGEIANIEKQLRAKITERKKARGEGENDEEIIIIPGEGALGWPLLSERSITAYFYDPTYPYRRFFEHPGIDIDTTGATKVLSAADGIVGIVKNLGWVRDESGKILYPAYNYVLILHDNGLSTVYGHLSQIDITEGQEVVRGQVIGLSGGAPGTAGAGRLTTGDHLHFEVRLNGIPVNPLEYLS